MMPLTLNVGFSRKVGEANYGSRGASVNLQVELEGGALRNPSQLRRDISNLFRYTREAVNEELARVHSATRAAEPAPENGHSHVGEEIEVRAATPAQVRALYAISRKYQINLIELLMERFGCHQPEDLSLEDASSLISDLDGAERNGGAHG